MIGRGGDFDISKPTKGEQDHELLTYAEVCRRSAASLRYGALHDHLRTLADLLDQGIEARASHPSVWHLLGLRVTGLWIDQLTSPLPGSSR